MGKPDYFANEDKAAQREHERLLRLRESPEYELALRVWRHKMLELWEDLLNDKLSAEDAERLRQRAIGIREAVVAIDERLNTTRSWVEQTELARQERDEQRALEHVMADVAAERAAADLAEIGD